MHAFGAARAIIPSATTLYIKKNVAVSALKLAVTMRRRVKLELASLVCSYCISARTMQNFYPQEPVDFISGRIEMHREGKLAPITARKDCVDRTSTAKVATQIVAEADDYIIHPSNRSGLGANAYNVHRVGAMLRQIGADSAELEKA
eukprot:6845082-Pyramimonas_sp.AAC.1